MNEFETKQMIIEIGRRMWAKGFVAANDGNITVRINKNEILATASGVSKGFMNSDMILKIDINGNILTHHTKYKVSSEIKMHLLVYREREDINSVVHAHPPYSTAFSVAGVPLNKCVLPESTIFLGAVPIAPYATPSTDEVPNSIKPYVKETDVILLENHGAITFGKDLLSAYYKLETLEHSAKIIFIAMQMGKINILNKEKVSKLMDIREKMGITDKIIMCDYENETNKEELINKISNDIIKKLI